MSAENQIDGKKYIQVIIISVILIFTYPLVLYVFVFISTAPCAGYLGRRFTTRYVAMFCGVMVSLSFISCSLATRPLHLILPFFVAGTIKKNSIMYNFFHCV